MTEQPKKSTCKKCSREIKWGKKTLDGGKTIPIPLELDGSEHTEKVGDVWQCKKVPQNPQSPADKGQSKLTEQQAQSMADETVKALQAFGKAFSKLEVLEQMGRDISEMKTLLELLVSKHN